LFRNSEQREICAWFPLQLLSGGLKAAQPSAVVGPAGLEAINAFPGTEASLPGVVPDETKLSVTESAALRRVFPKMLCTVEHFRLL
jgi:hypothetical protein